MARAAMVEVVTPGPRQKSFGEWVVRAFIWLTFGLGSSILYGLYAAHTMFVGSTDLANALETVVNFALVSFGYLVIQIYGPLISLYVSGGSMVRAVADIGFSLTPGGYILILGTAAKLGAFSPTWLTYVVVGIVGLVIVIDIGATLFYLRATQKSFDTPAGHPG